MEDAENIDSPDNLLIGMSRKVYANSRGRLSRLVGAPHKNRGAYYIYNTQFTVLGYRYCTVQ